MVIRSSASPRGSSLLLAALLGLSAQPAAANTQARAAPAVEGAATWVPIGPYGGTVLAVGASPTVPDLMLASVRVSERPLYRSIDGGQSWQPVTGFVGEYISDIEFAADGTAYLATSVGLQVSSDGGVTWTAIPNPFGPPGVVEIDPATGDLWLGLPGPLDDTTVIQSTDGGATWIDRSPQQLGGTTALLLVPSSPLTVYAGFCCGLDFLGVLWASTDGGVNWDLASEDLPDAQIWRLVWDGGRVIAAGGESGTAEFGLFASDDGGSTWEPLHDATWPTLYARDIDIDPNDPSVLLVATEQGGIHRSDDGGESWSIGVTGTSGKSFNTARFAPGSSNLVLAGAGTFSNGSGDRGVLRSDNGGVSFVPRSSGLRGLHATSVAVHPDDPLQLAAAVSGTIEGSVYSSTDGGLSWDVESLPPHLYNRIEFAPDGILYAIADGSTSVAPEGVYRRETEGTWTAIGPDQGAAFETQGSDLRFSALNPDLILLAGNDLGSAGFEGTIWRSLTAGDSWEKVYESPGVGRVTAVEILADGTDQTMVAALQDQKGNGGALRSIDGGETWSESFTGLPSFVHGSGLCLSPDDPQRVYLATEFGTGLFTSVDGGSSWNLTGPPVGEMRSITCDGDVEGVLYGGLLFPSDLLRSTDFGASFESFGAGLDASTIRQIVWASNPARLWAATSAGVWRHDLPVLFADGFESGSASGWSTTVGGS